MSDLERERQELEHIVGWHGYEIIAGQDHGKFVTFKVKRQKAQT